MDLAALAATFADDVVVTEPSSLPYGGTRSRGYRNRISRSGQSAKTRPEP
jgi:hypothetical protein